MLNAALSETQLSIFEFARGCGLNTPSAVDIATTLNDLKKVQGSALLIGGLAVIHYGYKRFTEDVDILYAHADGTIAQRLKKDFKKITKAKTGWLHFVHRRTGVRLELIPEGGLTTYGFIPGPKLVGADGDFISLKGLLWLKIVSGRGKDIVDIIEITKQRPDEVRVAAAELPAQYHERMSKLMAQAKREYDADPHRLRPEDIDRSEEPAPVYGRKKNARASRKPKRARGTVRAKRLNR
jgi:hypothetical protein